MDDQHTYKLRKAARLLGITRKRLFTILREQKAIDASNAPAPNMLRLGYFAENRSYYHRQVTGKTTRITARITGAGIAWLTQIIVQQALEK